MISASEMELGAQCGVCLQFSLSLPLCPDPPPRTLPLSPINKLWGKKFLYWNCGFGVDRLWPSRLWGNVAASSGRLDRRLHSPNHPPRLPHDLGTSLVHLLEDEPLGTGSASALSSRAPTPVQFTEAICPGSPQLQPALTSPVCPHEGLVSRESQLCLGGRSFSSRVQSP